MLYLIKKQMSKTQAKKLSFKFVPYLFIAVTILTTFGSNSGTWAWTNLNDNFLAWVLDICVFSKYNTILLIMKLSLVKKDF